MRRALIALVVLTACSEHHDAPRPARPPLVHSSQSDLARELDDADRTGTWNDVRARWQGRELHWTVTRQRMLCRTADACHVAAFPIQRPAHHGWMPALRFAAGEFAKLDAKCGTAEQCEVEIVGTLDQLVVSPELPTSLKLSDVRIAG
jgi:hypothetical protein